MTLRRVPSPYARPTNGIGDGPNGIVDKIAGKLEKACATVMHSVDPSNRPIIEAAVANGVLYEITSGERRDSQQEAIEDFAQTIKRARDVVQGKPAILVWRRRLELNGQHDLKTGDKRYVVTCGGTIYRGEK